VPGKVTYYLIMDYRSTEDVPAGVARRRWLDGGGFQDEVLTSAMSWEFSPVIVEWKRAEATDDLVEVSEAEAERIIERLRQRWSALG
jgi:hypothetical protein